MIKTPTYHVFHMYRHHQGGTLLDSTLLGAGEVGIGEWMVPNVTESVSEDGDGVITITVNNLSADQSEEVEISLVTGGAEYQVCEARVVTGEMRAYNTFAEPEQVTEQEFSAYEKTADGVKAVLPACSVVELRLKRA